MGSEMCIRDRVKISDLLGLMKPIRRLIMEGCATEDGASLRNLKGQREHGFYHVLIQNKDFSDRNLYCLKII